MKVLVQSAEERATRAEQELLETKQQGDALLKQIRLQAQRAHERATRAEARATRAEQEFKCLGNNLKHTLDPKVHKASHKILTT